MAQGLSITSGANTPFPPHGNLWLGEWTNLNAWESIARIPQWAIPLTIYPSPIQGRLTFWVQTNSTHDTGYFFNYETSPDSTGTPSYYFAVYQSLSNQGIEVDWTTDIYSNSSHLDTGQISLNDGEPHFIEIAWKRSPSPAMEIYKDHALITDDTDGLYLNSNWRISANTNSYPCTSLAIGAEFTLGEEEYLRMDDVRLYGVYNPN